MVNSFKSLSCPEVIFTNCSLTRSKFLWVMTSHLDKLKHFKMWLSRSLNINNWWIEKFGKVPVTAVLRHEPFNWLPVVQPQRFTFHFGATFCFLLEKNPDPFLSKNMWDSSTVSEVFYRSTLNKRTYNYSKYCSNLVLTL